MKHNLIIIIFVLVWVGLSIGCLSQDFRDTNSQVMYREMDDDTLANENDCLFVYESAHGRHSIMLPKHVSDLLEAAVIHKKKLFKREALPLVRTPMGIFIIRGQEYVWPGYASVSSQNKPKYDISLPSCFNIPTNDYMKIIDSYNNPLELERLFRHFFESI